MIQAIVTDYDRLQDAEHAAALEAQLNAAVGRRTFYRSTDYLERGRNRPKVLQFQFLFWGLVNIAGWVGAAVVLTRAYGPDWAIALGAVGVVMWIVTLLALHKRNQLVTEQRARLGSSTDETRAERTGPDDTGGPSSE